MRPTSATWVVITDTSLLINLTHTGHLHLLGRTPPYRFAVPDEVVSEVTEPDQRQAVETALDDDVIARISLESIEDLVLYSDFLRILGAGESACLALAKARGWLIVCDEKRVFLREARGRLGNGRLLNTVGLYLIWIRLRVLTVEQADEAKHVLETRRFRMSFGCFADIV